MRFLGVFGRFRAVRDAEEDVARAVFMASRLAPRRLEDEYTREHACGRGCFGECFWVKHKSTGFLRVAKRIAKKRSQAGGVT